MRFDAAALRAGARSPSPFGSQRRSRLLRRLWLLIVWPGVRTVLRVSSLPLTLLGGLPAWLFTLASVVRSAHLVAGGQFGQACTMLLAAWVCGTLVFLANWPRRNL